MNRLHLHALDFQHLCLGITHFLDYLCWTSSRSLSHHFLWEVVFLLGCPALCVRSALHGLSAGFQSLFSICCFSSLTKFWDTWPKIQRHCAWSWYSCQNLLQSSQWWRTHMPHQGIPVKSRDMFPFFGFALLQAKEKGGSCFQPLYTVHKTYLVGRQLEDFVKFCHEFTKQWPVGWTFMPAVQHNFISERRTKSGQSKAFFDGQRIFPCFIFSFFSLRRGTENKMIPSQLSVQKLLNILQFWRAVCGLTHTISSFQHVIHLLHRNTRVGSSPECSDFPQHDTWNRAKDCLGHVLLTFSWK